GRARPVIRHGRTAARVAHDGALVRGPLPDAAGGQGPVRDLLLSGAAVPDDRPGAARARGETSRARTLTILGVGIAALLLPAMPGSLRPTGIALAGPVILWLALLRPAPARHRSRTAIIPL